MVTSESQTELKAGTILEGKYRLERELGSGGMGQVFLAEHETIERTVAIKVLHRDLTGDESVRKRFETEAKAIARLKHPNCVMLYEFGFSEQLGAMFAVFEYAEGRSLEHWIDHQLPVADVLEVGKQVAAGMHHAHQQSVIHRDLKPENIMAVPNGDSAQMKVLDFGIARIAEDSEKATRLTKAGQMFGTPPYMSPEQVRAKLDITHATDIYAIGVILYELLEGRLPFLGDTPISTVMMHLNEEVPPLQRQDVPQQLEQIVMRCLEKEPEDRFDTCDSLRQALESVSWSRSHPTVLTGENDPPQFDSGDSGETQSSGAVAAKTTDSESDSAERQQESDDDGPMTPDEIASAPTVAPGSGDYQVMEPDEEDESDGPVTTDDTSQAPTTQEIEDQARTQQRRRRLVLVAAASVAGLVLLGAVVMLISVGDRDSDELTDSGEADEVAVVEAPSDEPADREDSEPAGGENETLGEEDEELAVLEEEAEQEDEESEQPAGEGEESETSPQASGDDQTDSSSSATGSEPAPTPAPTPSPEPEPSVDSSEESEPDEPAQPGSLRLDRRRRGDDDDDDPDEDLEQPQGIGLPDRN